MRGQMPKPAMLPYTPQRHPCFRNATPGSRHYAARAQCPGAAPRQHSNAASSPPQPCIGSATSPRTISGLFQEPRNKKSVRIATFLRLRIVARCQNADRSSKTQQKRHISSLREQRRVRNRKKVAKMPSFCFCNRIDRRNEEDPAKTRRISWRTN